MKVLIVALLLSTSVLVEAQFNVGQPGFAADISRRSSLIGRYKFDYNSRLGFNHWLYHQIPLIITNNVMNARGGVSGELLYSLWITNRVGEDYLYRPFGDLLTNINDITITAWVYPFASLTNNTYNTEEHPVWTISAPGGAGRTALYIGSNSISIASDNQSGGGNQSINRFIGLNVSNWNFVAAGEYKLNVMPGNGKMFMYVNGQMFSTNRTLQSTDPTDIFAVGGSLFGSSPKATNKFQGLTDEVMIYAKGLRPEELNWIYNNTFPRSLGNTEEGELFAAAVPPGARTNEWYVSTTGSDANSGTNISQPKSINWIFTRAGTGKTDVQPGDTVWFRGGTYTASIPSGTGGPTSWTNLTAGTATSPITLRNYPNERAIFYGYTNLTMLGNQGKWTRIIGFEFFSDNPIKYNPNDPPQTFNTSISVGGYSELGFSNTVANCVFHGLGNCIGANSAVAGTNINLYGNVFYMNGWQAFSDSQFLGTGYPMYVRQDQLFKGTPYIVKHNLFAPNFSYQMHSFSSGSSTNADIHAIENGWWLHGSCATNHRPNVNAQWLTQVSGIITNFVFGGNVFYIPYTNNFSENILHGRPSDPGPVINTTFTNNYMHGGQQVNVTLMHAYTNLLFTNNIFIGQSAFTMVGGQVGGVNQSPPGPVLNVNRDRNTYFGPSVLSTLFRHRVENGSAGEQNLNISNWRAATGQDNASTMTATSGRHTNATCWKNEYEVNRAHVMIVNADTDGTIAHNNYDVDVSNTFANGTSVKVRFACNFYQSPPHATVTVSGGKITIPMTNLVVETPIYHNRLGTFYTPGDESTNGTVAGFVLTTW